MNLSHISRLGKLEHVNVREIWPIESDDFTPWLAENLDELGDILGMELQLEDTEVPVGKFSLDILARDTREDRLVAIENQLELSDHRHLGQLLTYTGSGAQTMVWVATEFTQEHRAALSWLNEYTAESMRFFGIIVDVIKIGDSDSAPFFQVAESPPEWSREAPYESPATLSPTAERYVNFWKPLLEDLNAKHRWNVLTHNPRSSQSAGSGYSYINRVMRFSWDGWIRVELVIRSSDEGWNKTVFEALQERKEDIEATLGTELIWERLDGQKSSRAVLQRLGSINDSESELTETRLWMAANVVKFKDVFQAHIGEVIRDLSG